jgi:biotin-(acetyl-CoA carboxylase) ligase
MILLTDNIEFAQRCIPRGNNWQHCEVSTLAPPVAVVAGELFNSTSIMQTEVAASEYWEYLFAVDCASKSQYDVLSRLAVSGQELPDRTLCCAGSGDEFHGFKSRSWKACRGNIHLSAYIKPQREIPGAAVGFIIAAVIAALQTVESFDLQGAPTGIKWVNDILVQGAKVGGVLARLQTQGPITESAVVGIGLNVEQRPPVKRDLYVPKVAAMADFAAAPESCRHPDVFPRLMDSLGNHLENLCQGGFTKLLDLYRQNSLVLGHQVTVCEDSRDGASGVIARGLVESIGASLELFIEGQSKPVTKGRLRLDNNL